MAVNINPLKTYWLLYIRPGLTLNRTDFVCNVRATSHSVAFAWQLLPWKGNSCCRCR